MKCKTCENEIKSSWNKKFCALCLLKRKSEQDKVYRDKNLSKIRLQKKKYYYSGKKYTCAVCNTEYERRTNTKFCSRKCFFQDSKKSRLGKNNPAYRNGTRMKGVNVSSKHLSECRKYREKFIDEHGYIFCEKCGTNSSIRFEVHHIIFASEKPRHLELHNDRNKIMLCIQCHNDMHSKKENRTYLVEQRKLVELFGKSIL